jgi:hypothetical protein
MDDDEPRASAHDEVFDDGSSAKSRRQEVRREKSAEAKAEAVKPWGQGKLHLPVIHRMKLDRPGIGLGGKKEVAGSPSSCPAGGCSRKGSAIRSATIASRRCERRMDRPALGSRSCSGARS